MMAGGGGRPALPPSARRWHPAPPARFQAGKGFEGFVHWKGAQQRGGIGYAQGGLAVISHRGNVSCG